MITEKDRDIVNEIQNACEWGAFELAYKKLQEYADHVRAESAEQARKEVSDIVIEYLYRNGIFKRTNGKAVDKLCAAILGDSANVSTDSEKLAIAVNALEEISSRDWVENALSPQWAARTAGIALNEVQK